ncbi:MAG: MBL fold metallo-hydrolase, partial [Salinirussus sp.]
DTLVDTGHVNPESTRRLKSELGGVERVVLTHPHIDHVGASLTVPDVAARSHVVFDGMQETLRNFDDFVQAARDEQVTLGSEGDVQRSPDEDYFPLDVAYAGDEISIDRVVEHGDSVRVGPYECEVIHTPGHASQHMALFHADSGVMLSGDIVSRNGHYMFGAVQWDVGEYRLGLDRVGKREPTLLLPGHGSVMTDPMARVEEAKAKADRAEQAILDIVNETGPVGPRTLARKAFDAGDETVDFLANVAAAYAIHLADQGRVRVQRQPEFAVRPL